MTERINEETLELIRNRDPKTHTALLNVYEYFGMTMTGVTPSRYAYAILLRTNSEPAWKYGPRGYEKKGFTNPEQALKEGIAKFEELIGFIPDTVKKNYTNKEKK